MATVPTGYVFWDVSANKSYAAGTTFPTLGNGDYMVPATTSNDGYYHQYEYYTSYTDSWSGLEATNCWAGTVQAQYVTKSQKLPFDSINGKPVVRFAYNNCTFTQCPTTTNSGSTSSLSSNNTNLKHIHFYKCTNMTSAPQLPAGITHADYCFYGTKIVSAPSNFTSLNLVSADYCFYGVSTLTTMPNISAMSNLASARYMFCGCSGITSVSSLPSNLENAYGMFDGCTSITTPPTLPSTITEMGYMFRGCTSLTSAPTIPSLVGTIYRTFYGCTSLEGPIRIESHVIGSSSESFYNTSPSKKIILLKTTVSGTSNQSKLKTIVSVGSNNGNVYAGIVADISSFTAIRGNYDSSNNTFTEAVNGTYCKLTVDYSSVNITGALLKPPTLTDSNGNTVSVTWKIGTLAGSTLSSSGSQIQDSGTIVSVVNLGSSETTETYTVKMNSSHTYNSVAYEWVSGEKNATLTYSNVIFDVNPTGTATGYHMEAPNNETGHFFKDDVYIDGDIKTLGSIFTGMADEFAKGAGTNHIIIAGFHVCFGAEAITLTTANTYQETEVSLPYTYTSPPICFASFQNRAGRARTAYCTAKGDGNNPVTYTGVYLGCYGTTANQNYNVNWLTIGK